MRERVGDQVPIVAQLDIHSNVSRRMVDIADVLIGRESYPEVDRAERGRECAEVMVRILREGMAPKMALHQIPMLWGLNQVTAHPPMSEAIDYLHDVESRSGVVCASIATSFPLADIPDLRASAFARTLGLDPRQMRRIWAAAASLPVKRILGHTPSATSFTSVPAATGNTGRDRQSHL